ncbi:MAG: S1C family serine protease [Roseibacillus sp.]|jgi:serine protease Do
MTIKISKAILGVSLAALPFASAQFTDPPTKDRAKLIKQAGQLFQTLEPVVAKISHGAVEVRVWRKRVGFGTVVETGKVLAKWSEVKRDVRSLSCRTGAGEWLPAKVVGIYRDADLAVLKVEGMKAKPLVLGDEDNLRVGSFLALARPDGEAAAMGIVSVLPRSLRESDRAFLGILMDLEFSGPGVRIRRVQPDTGAAASGLKDGDVITKVMNREVNGNFELSSVLQRLEPGQMVRIGYRRGKERKLAEVKLGGRPDPRRIPYSRMERMNNMGGHRYSDVKDGFRDVIQSDMQLAPEDCGAPVIDLDGRVIGIAVARAGRIKTFIIPASSVRGLLATKPAQLRLDELAGRARSVEREVPLDPFEVMRRKMEEMRRLMEEIEGMEK